MNAAKASRDDAARLLRECAVDLIRASDLLDGGVEAAMSAHTRIHVVLRELSILEAQVAHRARAMELRAVA